MSNAGIDYSMGRSNFNPETGIHFGVISQHSVTQAWADSAEGYYGEPTCPKCGGEAVDAVNIECEDWPKLYSHGCVEYACENCKVTLDSSDVFSEEALAWSYKGDGYDLCDCLDSDIMVLKSPFFTLTKFCSPCVPGAGDLNNAGIVDGVKTYCLGHDWFESGEAPYPVFSVDTNSLVPRKAA